MRRGWGWLVIGMLTACTCDPRLTDRGQAQLVAEPSSLVLAPAWVGLDTTGTVLITNQGVATTASVTVSAPFSVSPKALSVGPGDTAPLQVHLLATAPGGVTGVLRVGDLAVAISADAQPVPECADTTCSTGAFDATTGQCTATPISTGAACGSRCFTGTCAEGACVGTALTCDDANACTVDACSDTDGCVHAPRACPAPGTACRVAACDAVTGCGTGPAPDGAPCGPDDCASPTVEVCVTGQCLRRTRPLGPACTPRWAPLALFARSDHALAWDGVRHRVLLFGGADHSVAALMDDTWEWDGASWRLLRPPNAPSRRAGHTMTWDPVRQRVVLFGGSAIGGRLNDCWEWDGTTWTPASVGPIGPPPMRAPRLTWDPVHARVLLVASDVGSTVFAWHYDGANWVLLYSVRVNDGRADYSVAWDLMRGRAVLFGGGSTTGGAPATWEFDGTTWSAGLYDTSPRFRDGQGMTWSSAAQRVVLFGGAARDGKPASPLDDTWTWEGSTWSSRPSANRPTPRGWFGMADDPERQRLVLQGGDDSLTPLRDTWEWDGVTWRQAAMANFPVVLHTATWDEAHQVVVGLDGEATWTWDGARWTRLVPRHAPMLFGWTSFAWDTARQRGVLFISTTERNETWLWDGSDWHATPASPATPAHALPGRTAMAYDPLRQRVVRFGGNGPRGAVDQTWLWDGATWTLAAPAHSPSARHSHAMAWDPVRERVVLFGGLDANGESHETWEWDGSDWHQRLTAGYGPYDTALGALAWDARAQRLVFVSRATASVYELDGAAWTYSSMVSRPESGEVKSLVFDPVRQRLLLLGKGVWAREP